MLICLGCDDTSRTAVPTGATPATPASHPAFDAARAFSFLERQTQLGPRPAGSPGHEAAIPLLTGILEPLVDEVILQEFTASSRHTSLALTNIIGVIHAKASPAKRVVLGAHWDTRPVADWDATPANWTQPISGANDGASGVAVLLEIAHALSEQRADIEVVLVLFDGEDYGGVDGFDFILGSTHYVAEMENPGLKPDWMILADMVGDANLGIRIEPSSTPALVTRIWTAASRLGVNAFIPEAYQGSILDDHTPFLEAGVPAVDLIDFIYPHWHTTQDTVDKCSPASLKQVGDVLLHMIYQELR